MSGGISSIGSWNNYATNWSNRNNGTNQTTSSLASSELSSKISSTSAADEFRKYANMSPTERIRYNYLKSHNLTESDLAAMSPEQRKAIENEIKELIKKKLTDNKNSNSPSAFGVNLYV
ncbi:MAG: hypothetical protein PHX43_07660 [Alphaproteobacteria bacterium]|nr:hypothetical protein [Alphaproteobacteria bacterium]